MRFLCSAFSNSDGAELSAVPVNQCAPFFSFIKQNEAS